MKCFTRPTRHTFGYSTRGWNALQGALHSFQKFRHVLQQHLHVTADALNFSDSKKVQPRTSLGKAKIVSPQLFCGDCVPLACQLLKHQGEVWPAMSADRNPQPTSLKIVKLLCHWIELQWWRRDCKYEIKNKNKNKNNNKNNKNKKIKNI